MSCQNWCSGWYTWIVFKTKRKIPFVSAFNMLKFLSIFLSFSFSRPNPNLWLVNADQFIFVVLSPQWSPSYSQVCTFLCYSLLHTLIWWPCTTCTRHSTKAEHSLTGVEIKLFFIQDTIYHDKVSCTRGKN